MMLRRILATAALLTGYSAVAENLVGNAGFEEGAGGKAPVAWKVPAPYEVRNGVGRNGGRGLVIEAEKPFTYVVPQQEIGVRPGACYHASAWVRTTDVKNGRAMICLEWYDKDGKWLNGAYPQGTGGTGDWRHIHVVSQRLPANAAKLTVCVYLAKGACGKVVFDDVRVEALAATPVVGLYSDAFRNRAADGEVTFFADLNLLAAGKRSTDVRGCFTLPGAKGRCTLPAARLTDDMAQLTVEADSLTSGLVQFSLADTKTGEDLGSASLAFEKLASWPKKGVWVDRHNRLIVDGKPFFPLGMYWMGVGEKDLDTYVKGPFNCLMPYARPNRQQLDLCAARGLKTLYNIKDYYAFHMRGREGIVTPEDASRAVEKIVTEFKDHPALLGWYPNDEIGLEHRVELVGRQRQLERLDPDHPSWTMLFQVAQMRDYLPCFDICGSDPYPFEASYFENPYFWPKLQRETTFGARAVWQAVKVHDHSAYFNPKDREKILREPVPTQQEIRNMTWQALCAGANGIFFYSFFDLKKMDWKTPFDRRFADVCQVASELKALEDVFLSTEKGVSTELTGESPRKLACRAWRCGGRSLLAVVNLTWKEQRGKVTLGELFETVRPVMGSALGFRNGNEVDVSLPAMGLSVMEFK